MLHYCIFLKKCTIIFQIIKLLCELDFNYGKNHIRLNTELIELLLRKGFLDLLLEMKNTTVSNSKMNTPVDLDL